MRCVVTIWLLVALAASEGHGEVLPPLYTDQFGVQVDGGPEVAQKFALKHGFAYHAKILDDYYVLSHHRIAKRSLSRSEEHHTALSNEPQVRWFSQQKLKRRSKRDFQKERTKFNDPRRPDMWYLEWWLSQQELKRRSKRDFWEESSQRIMTEFNDPKWSDMWYLNRGKGLDMNVQEAWAEGVTGRGIVVTILNDGLEKDHPDIIENYDQEASYDANNRDGDPQPRYDLTNSNKDGTRSAGVVAASANNSICAVGVAYEALVGRVRMLDGAVTDSVEAQSLSLNPQHIDIYSVSWGPEDDGKTVEGPGPLTFTDMKRGILNGRSGKGSIFVWASGIGGREYDNCNCDGYASSMWTLSINSVSENGRVPWYSEACSSTLATTYSNGAKGEKQIVTTDLHHGCTSAFSGTAGSAALATGICALTLEANKNLTWRDMQHIVVRTARPSSLIARDWKINGAGRSVSHYFGYGLMDAGAMVKLAKRWNPAPVQKLCEIRSDERDEFIPTKSHVELSLIVQCEHVRYLEHVQANITLTASRRGDIHIYLTSPSGTRSILLSRRPIDDSLDGFSFWPFMTVHNWGEDPDGIWKLEVHNEGRFYGNASLKEWSLHMYGTTENPDHPSTTTTTDMPITTTSSATTTTTVSSTPKPKTSTPKPRSLPFKPTSQYYPLTRWLSNFFVGRQI